MIIWNRENKKQAAAAAILLLAGIITGNLAEAYVPVHTSQPEVTAVSEKETIPETDAVPSETETREARKDANAYEPSITLLNLAYYFPGGADSSDVTQSYAGKVYQELSIKDSDWLAGVYDLADIKPAKMAAKLGKPSSAAIGAYNPNDDTQDPDNPDTWTINNWKKVNISFVNGSGQPINGYSNVKEILSMASVYTYQKDMLDAEAFKEYANRLWKDSHSFSYSMSDVYYCDGCLDMSLEELVQEAEEEEFAGELAASGDALEAGHDMDSQDSDGGEENEEQKTSSGKKETADREPSSSRSDSIPSEGSSPSKEEHENEYAEPNDIVSLEASLENREEIPTGGTIRKSTVDPTQWDNIGPGEEPMATPNEALYNTSESEASRESEVSEQTESSEQAFSENMGNDTASNIAGNPVSDSMNEAAPVKETRPSKPSHNQGYNKHSKGDCPGHVNLNITVKILGLKDSKGLIQIDPIGNNPENMTEGGWDGWDDYSIKMVEAIHAQDWYQDYGLSISTINMRNPLSASEIDAYIASLPPETSKKRKEIIQFALSSVGKVPYYWGGKPSRAGYEGNYFGTPMDPDTKGRILKGLDCSGWINWVYWSVTGERLAGESTSSLILCGKPIKRSELKPGDIIVKTGTGAHVVMFLGWTSNGQMQVIHESSASVNNVTVKTMTADWPYYRNLLD